MKLLEGFTALDLSDLKGQFCGRLLSDQGMEVIKVELPSGDPVRRLGPFKDNDPSLEKSLPFAALNAGKKSITLDWTHAEGRELLLSLVEKVDVVLESFAPGALAEYGLSADDLRRRNPKLVVTSVTGFGQTGERSKYLSPDLVVMAMGGLMSVSGDPKLPPTNGPETQSFYSASIYAALGTLLSLWQRDKDGTGDHVDIAAQEAMASHDQVIRIFSTEGAPIRRYGSQHHHVSPANVFPTNDGYVYLFVTHQHWKNLLGLWADHPAELDDEAFKLNHNRRAKADWINEIVSNYTRRYGKRELVAIFQDAGIPCLAVYSPSEFMTDDQIEHRKFFQPVSHPVLGDYAQMAFPVLLNGERPKLGPPPLLGQHTREVLGGRLGVSAAQFEMLFAQGVV